MGTNVDTTEVAFSNEITSYPIVVGSDLDAVRAATQDVYAPNATSFLQRSPDKKAILRIARLGALTFGQVGYGGAIRMVPAPLTNCFHINVPVTGTTHSVCGRHSIVSSKDYAAVFSPNQLMEIDWSIDCEQIAIKIERDALQTELEALLGHDATPVQFELGFDLSTPAGQSWMRNLRYVLAEMQYKDGAIHKPFAGDHYAGLLMRTLLLAQIHNHTDNLTKPVAPARRRSVQMVIELIEERPDAPYTASDLAFHAGLSLRALQAGFHREVGMSPTTYLTTVRLSRVHADLIDSDVDRVSTAQIAYRWGFNHLGRFAKAYRTRYGEPPSDTLRRTR